MLTEIIFAIFYIAIVIGSFYIFAHFIKKETGVNKIEGTTWCVTMLAAISLPNSLLVLLKAILTAILLVIA
jgi:hypothetical protein